MIKVWPRGGRGLQRRLRPTTRLALLPDNRCQRILGPKWGGRTITTASSQPCRGPVLLATVHRLDAMLLVVQKPVPPILRSPSLLLLDSSHNLPSLASPSKQKLHSSSTHVKFRGSPIEKARHNNDAHQAVKRYPRRQPKVSERVFAHVGPFFDCWVLLFRLILW